MHINAVLHHFYAFNVALPSKRQAIDFDSLLVVGRLLADQLAARCKSCCA